jgi:peptidoglycan/LPS O-acetylase OafA/YrhL
MLRNKIGQATLEYIAAIVMTIVFIAFLMSVIDEPIRDWWDALGQKVAAPCPSENCVKNQ